VPSVTIPLGYRNRKRLLRKSGQTVSTAWQSSGSEDPMACPPRPRAGAWGSDPPRRWCHGPHPVQGCLSYWHANRQLRRFDPMITSLFTILCAACASAPWGTWVSPGVVFITPKAGASKASLGRRPVGGRRSFIRQPSLEYPLSCRNKVEQKHEKSLYMIRASV